MGVWPSLLGGIYHIHEGYAVQFGPFQTDGDTHDHHGDILKCVYLKKQDKTNDDSPHSTPPLHMLRQHERGIVHLYFETREL